MRDPARIWQLPPLSQGLSSHSLYTVNEFGCIIIQPEITIIMYYSPGSEHVSPVYPSAQWHVFVAIHTPLSQVGMQTSTKL